MSLRYLIKFYIHITLVVFIFVFRSATNITCQVAGAPGALADQPSNGYMIRITHSCSEVLGQTFRFEYRPDPVIENIAPRQSFFG